MEKRQIEERLPGFVATLLSSGVDLEPIARGLLKPLRCLWMDRNSPGWANGEQDLAGQHIGQCGRCAVIAPWGLGMLSRLIRVLSYFSASLPCR